jgi:L-2-hydroxyglutarate oxidase LhgO
VSTELAPSTDPDVVLVGGIMSATLVSLLGVVAPDWSVTVFESGPEVAGESSDAWNNAGTGHAALCELNYTPAGPDGAVDVSEALTINEQFQVSRQFWSHLVRSGLTGAPKEFITPVPHIGFVTGVERRTDGRWTVTVTDAVTGEERRLRTRFVFVGAGGGALPLLQRSGIREIRGFGGFPISGRFLRSRTLRDFAPEADAADWDMITAGQRVQVIKRDPATGRGVLQFGTELVVGGEGTIAGLLGASPGASTAVSAMLTVLERCFPDRIAAWRPALEEAIPSSYGRRLADDPALLAEVRAETMQTLELNG